MSPYLPILFALLIAIVFALAFLAMSHWLGPRRPFATKNSTYECGMAPVGHTRHRFSVKFYLVAVLFLLFDLEAVFLFPWTTAFTKLVSSGFAIFALAEMAFFVGVLFIGWYYCVRRGALEWD